LIICEHFKTGVDILYGNQRKVKEKAKRDIRRKRRRK